MPPEIAVVVSTYRRGEGLRSLLSALAQQSLAPDRWELVVVDNCSNDPATDAVLSELPQQVPCATRVLRTTQNRGPAAARNLGWRSTAAPVVAFIDDDVIPDRLWLEVGLAEFDDPHAGVVQGRTTAPTDVDIHALPAWAIWRVIEQPSPHFEGCNIFYRRVALERTTGFDESFGWWGEDAALGWQVVEAGWRRAFCHSATVVHPIELRGVGWFVRNGLREHHEVTLARRHPGFRAEAFWRTWAYRRRGAAFTLAVVSGLVGIRWRPAWVGVLPYLWIGRPSVRHRPFPRLCAETVLVDAARAASHLRGSLREQILVL